MTATPAPSRHSLSLVDLGSLLFLGAVFGAAFLFLRVAAPEVGPVWAAEIRLAIGAATLATVFGRRTLRVAKGRVGALLVVGATFSAVPFSLIAFAALTLPAGMTALLNAATPAFTALIGVGLLGQPLSRRAAAGLGIGVVSVVVLVGWSPLALDGRTIIAVAAGLGAAVSYAVGGNYARAKLVGVPQLELATGMLVAGVLIAFPVAILTGPPRMPALDGAVSLIGVGTISTALAWPVYFRILARTTPMAASTVTFIVPAFALAWGSLVLAEPVGVGLLVGFALILLSLTLVLGIRFQLPVPGRRVVARALRSSAT